jgi:4-hydroxy-4-methyl-2-oxoglutarate aldolase
MTSSDRVGNAGSGEAASGNTASSEAASSKAASGNAASMIPGRVRRAIERPDPDVLDALAHFPSSLISDCQNRMGAMDGLIRPLLPGRGFCGPAITVEEVEGGNLMSHAALELAQPGDVLVIDAKGVATRACWGAVQTLAAERLGLAAVVVNGVVRDCADIATRALPIYALGTSPGGPLKGWGGNVNLPIACGGVAVCPGDVVVGDDDGVVVVSRELAGELPELCVVRQRLEQRWTERVEGGTSTVDAVGLHDSLARQGVRYT